MDLERVKSQIKHHEGYRDTVYKDSLGYRTIGYGHLCLPEDQYKDDVAYPHDVLEKQFEDDFDVCVIDVQHNISFFQDLPPAAQEALVNLSYNMGIKRLLQFKKTLKHLREGSFVKASEELLDSRYARQVGKRSNEVADMIASCEVPA
tara:strand:- start:1578 stop:2021 length:444 start_codon:yes stop_codon:yes gene_type:complete